jgi:hypothetical protein
MSDTKAHTRYRLKPTEDWPKGEIVPGVTTITRQLGWATEALVKWANNLGLKGIDSRRFADDKADIGTLGHQMVMDYLEKKKTDTKNYTAEQIRQAENVLLSFFAWEKGHKIEPTYFELELVSEKYRYGGRCDLIADVDGNRELIDIKTGGVWPEHYIQIGGGYYQLLKENNINEIKTVRLLNLPRTEDEAFKDILVPNLNLCWEVFLHCRQLYDLQKRFK